MDFIKAAEKNVKMDIRILQQLKEQLELLKNARVHIGIFADKNRTRPDGATMCEVAFKNEFGFETLGKREDGTLGSVLVRPRSFLVMPISTGIPLIMAKVKGMFSKAVYDGKLKGWLKLLGHAAEARVDAAFNSSGFGTWDPNTDWTVAKKKSDMPLIDSGSMRRAIASRVVEK